MLRISWQKPFTIINAYVYTLFSYSFSFDPSLWWTLLLSVAAIKGHPVLRDNAPQQMTMFPDIII